MLGLGATWKGSTRSILSWGCCGGVISYACPGVWPVTRAFQWEGALRNDRDCRENDERAELATALGLGRRTSGLTSPGRRVTGFVSVGLGLWFVRCYNFVFLFSLVVFFFYLC